MKSKNVTRFNNIHYHQVILTLVLLLLILPVAQAIHLNEHDNFNNEYDCLVCHGHSQLDDGAHSSESSYPLLHLSLTDIHVSQGPFTTFITIHPDTIRGPPSR